jgi:hypothetical protein
VWFAPPAKLSQVRGKKNLVLEQSLAGPIEIFVNFSTLQDHGVDKVFFLENDNVDASQKNVIFLARGEKANQPIAIAGMYVQKYFRRPSHYVLAVFPESSMLGLFLSQQLQMGSLSRRRRFLLLYVVSLDPDSNSKRTSTIYSVFLRLL